MTARGDLGDMLSRHRAVVCVGSGGVGKTTVAASIALAAAESGKRTLCLTIDPARRLSNALGLESFPSEQVPIDPAWLARSGVNLKGELTVMMLDAKATFDDLIRRFSPTPEKAREILENRIYRQLSTNLAGTRSYMAMEKVLAVLADDTFDLVVLDTPPSGRALDFFDAPDRMVSVLDSPATRALVHAMEGGRRFSLQLVAVGLRKGMSALDRITGTTLLEEIAGLLSAMNVLFGGFASRAREVGDKMRGSEIGYVLVTAPSGPALADATSLGRQLADRGLRVSAQVINRMSPPLGSLPEALAGSDEFATLGLPHRAEPIVLEAARQSQEKRTKEEERLASLPREPGVSRVLVPGFARDIHRPDRLLELGRRIVSGAA